MALQKLHNLGKLPVYTPTLADVFFADPGKALGCSTTTVMIH